MYKKFIRGRNGRLPADRFKSTIQVSIFSLLLSFFFFFYSPGKLSHKSVGVSVSLQSLECYYLSNVYYYAAVIVLLSKWLVLGVNAHFRHHLG